MSRAVSIHLGVNYPADLGMNRPLKMSEDVAWRMSGLANQAGYESMTVLRGSSATQRAVHDALTAAAGVLDQGDSLLVTFSGHGTERTDMEADERNGKDQGWCMADGVLLDDQLASYWGLFKAGVRIVVVSESCHSGGMDRDDEENPEDPRFPHYPPYATHPVHGPLSGNGNPQWNGQNGSGPVYRGEEPVLDYSRICTGTPRRDSQNIRAGVLLLTACGKDEQAVEGIFSETLLDLWANGTFPGSYCELFRHLYDRVSQKAGHHPQIMLAGSGDPAFPLGPAFRVNRHGGPYRGDDYGGPLGRGGDGYRRPTRGGYDGYR